MSNRMTINHGIQQMKELDVLSQDKPDDRYENGPSREREIRRLRKNAPGLAVSFLEYP
jgi:hypothetical protein